MGTGDSGLYFLELRLFATLSANFYCQDTKKSGTKPLKEAINTTPFHILFDGSPSVQTTSLSSADLVPSTNNSKPVYDVPLASIRTQAKL